MTKKIAAAIAVCAIVLISFLYLAAQKETAAVNSPDKAVDEGANMVAHSKNASQNSNETFEAGNVTGGGAGKAEGGGGGGAVGNSTNETMAEKGYYLNVSSTPSGFDIVAFYYEDGNFTNITAPTPYSLYVDVNTTACLAEPTGYNGIWWQVDGGSYNMSKCYGYTNGCLIVMNRTHDVRMRQNS
jgi:hypothetical protein